MLETKQVFFIMEQKQVKNRKHQLSKISIGFSLYISLALIHELGHLAFLLLFGAKIYSFQVNYIMIGFDASLYGLEPYQKVIIHGAGILFVLIFGILFIKIGKKKNRDYIYYPSWISILINLLYIPYSLFLHSGDFHELIIDLSLTEYRLTLLLSSILLFLFVFYCFYCDLTKYENKRKEKKKLKEAKKNE